MSRSVLSTHSAIPLLLALSLTGACGHSSKTLDAFEASKGNVTGAGGALNPGTGGVGNNGTGNTGTGNTGNVSHTIDCPTPPGPTFACDAVASQQFDSASMKSFCVPPDVAQQVNQVMSLMGPAEKATQMIGVDGSKRNWLDIERSPDIPVPGYGVIRGYRYRDAGRGVNLDAGQDNRPRDNKNFATVFPAPSLRAASWDLDLEKRVGRAIGDETVASKNNMLLAPCMNIIRHPYWGRTQETYGEDMYHIGRMSTAFTVGLQEYVVGCAKHWAANNIEKERSKQDAVMTEQTLREIYGRHFEMVIQDGAMGCIMASYNMVNGGKATQNAHLLRKVLKAPLAEGGMGFEGLVLTDWWAMPGDMMVPDSALAQSITNEAVIAGTDIEVPWTLHYSVATLANADQRLVEEAARRILTQKFLFRSAREGDPWGLKPAQSRLTPSETSIAAHAPHEVLAEEATIKSAVLVANGLDGTPPVLPLPATVASIAVVGPDQSFSLISSSVPKSCGLDGGMAMQGQTVANPQACTFNYATDPALGDRGSSRVNADPERSYGPFRGIQQVAGSGRTVTSGKTAAEAANAEVVVVVVGYSPADEGEEYAIRGGGDRSSLNLPTGQNDFVTSVLDLNKPTIIVIETGSIVNLPWLAHANKNQATIWAGYPGQAGGLALGKLIFALEGANFAGKMPMAWPTQTQLDGFRFKDTETATTMGYLFGYRDYDKRKYVDGEAVDLVFPFGHGLSYSSFEYSNLQFGTTCEAPTLSKTAIVEFTVDIQNTSAVDGDEVAMLFVKPPAKPAGVTGERPWKELKSFARVSVPANGMTTARLPFRVQDLRRWEGGENGRWIVDSGEYTIVVAKNAEDAETTTNKLAVTIAGD